MIPRGDGDGWTYCAQGHKHWGIYVEVGRAEPGEVLKLTEPFPITIDPAALTR